jgi:D-aminopeptidase
LTQAASRAEVLVSVYETARGQGLQKLQLGEASVPLRPSDDDRLAKETHPLAKFQSTVSVSLATSSRTGSSSRPSGPSSTLSASAQRA